MTKLEKVRSLRIDDYNYPLPDERIAKHPLAQREQCKVLMHKDNIIEQHLFSEVPSLLPQDAVLIYNNTRVINARLRFQKITGSKIEIFCLEPVAPHDYQLIFQTTAQCTWLCLVGNSKRWKSGALTQSITVDGEPIKWKIENSWGEDNGVKGYYVMSKEFFDTFFYQAVVLKKYLTKEEVAATKAEATHLPPWDPMGTLAE